MKKSLKTPLLIIVLILLYYGFIGHALIIQRLTSNFLHYSKIRAIYYSVYILQCFFILCGVCLSLKLFIGKTRLDILKGLALILFAFFGCAFLVMGLVDGTRLIGGGIAQEGTILEFGEKVLSNTEGLEQKKLPDWRNWREELSLDNENDHIHYDHFNLNKKISSLSLDDLPPNTVIIAEEGSGNVTSEEFEEFGKWDVTNESIFKNSCERGYLLLYTADSKIVVYVKQCDKYRYFDSNEKADVIWIPE